MPLIALRVPMTASQSIENALAGSAYEYLPFPAFVEIGIEADATGVLATVTSGTDVLQEEGPVQIGTINVSPKYPDDYFLSDEAAPGDRLKIKLRDTSAAARVVMIGVRITPL